MDIGFLHLHHLVSVLYVVIIFLLALSLLSPRRETLLAVKGKLRFVQRFIESLMLLTGIYLAYKSPIGLSGLLLTKYLLIFIGIILVAIGLQQRNFFFMLAAVALFAYVYGLAYHRDFLLRPVEKQIVILRQEQKTDGATLYQHFCARCHGKNKEGGYLKAPSLAPYRGTPDMFKTTLIQGKNLMPAFPFLNDKEIAQLYQYVTKTTTKKGR